MKISAAKVPFVRIGLQIKNKLNKQNHSETSPC